MPTQISMSGGKKSKKLIRVLVPNKHVWWKNPKFTGMNFGTDTIIDFLNIGRCFTTLVVLYTLQGRLVFHYSCDTVYTQQVYVS